MRFKAKSQTIKNNKYYKSQKHDDYRNKTNWTPTKHIWPTFLFICSPTVYYYFETECKKSKEKQENTQRQHWIHGKT